MSSNDNIRDGFNGLLGGINKDLEAQKGNKKPKDYDIDIPAPDEADVKVFGSDKVRDENEGIEISVPKKDGHTEKPKAAQAKPESGDGTRVFDTVKKAQSAKPKLAEKDLSDFESEQGSVPPVKPGASAVQRTYRKPISKSSAAPQKVQKNSAPSNGRTHVFGTVSGGKPMKKKDTVSDGKKTTSAGKASAMQNRENNVKNTKTSSAPASKKSSRKKKNGILGSITRFVLYIVFVLAASVFCAVAIIKVSNDMFAFIKPENAITVTVPEDASTRDVAKILSDNDIIEYPTIFGLYMDFKKGRSSYYTDGYKSGEFELAPNMNYDDLIYSLSNSAASRQIVRLTFPEGSTVDEIIDILIKGGVQNTKEEYIDVIQNYDFTYRFVKELDTKNFKNGRKYRLEGYLFPDTYDFYTDAGAVDVINKFLINFNNKFDTTYYDAAYKHGLSVDEIINIAALIEKEARRATDMGKVSSVFHNRIKHSSQYPYLQSDATIQYAFPERKTTITPEDLKYDSPYNTYLYAGLPPSAIANPGLDAITFALYPENTSYYFFIANSRGETLFAKTLNGHNANIEMIRAENAAKKNQ